MKKTWRERMGLQPRHRKKVVAAIEPFTVVGDRTARDFCDRFDLQTQDKAHLSDDPAPHEFLNRLIQDGQTMDAIRFLAHALPEREAVRWACSCVRRLPSCYENSTAARALAATEAWIQSPESNTHNQVQRLSQSLTYEMPTAPCDWAVAAAARSQEGLSTEQQQGPGTPKHLTAHAVAGAINLAATSDTEQANEHYHLFLEMGIKIAQGKTPTPWNS